MSSPPQYQPLAQRKRQSLNLLASNPKRRKPSTGPSLLRQASFPPPSPPGPMSRSVSPASSVAVASTVSGMTAGTGTGAGAGAGAGGGAAAARKRGRKSRKSGVDFETESQLTSGSGARQAGPASAVGGAGAGAGPEQQVEEEEAIEEDENEDGNEMLAEDDEATKRQERKHFNMLIEAFNEDQGDRYLVWRRVRLKKDAIRKLVNHTLSQSVPPSVVTTVNGYTKVFIGELIELAREVQLEWLASAATLPNGEPVPADTPIEERTRQCHRGPLTPDHLREALRRYKRSAASGGTGFTGYSLMGKEAALARTGGRRVFR